MNSTNNNSSLVWHYAV